MGYRPPEVNFKVVSLKHFEIQSETGDRPTFVFWTLCPIDSDEWFRKYTDISHPQARITLKQELLILGVVWDGNDATLVDAFQQLLTQRIAVLVGSQTFRYDGYPPSTVFIVGTYLSPSVRRIELELFNGTAIGLPAKASADGTKYTQLYSAKVHSASVESSSHQQFVNLIFTDFHGQREAITKSYNLAVEEDALEYKEDLARLGAQYPSQIAYRRVIIEVEFNSLWPVNKVKIVGLAVPRGARILPTDELTHNERISHCSYSLTRRFF